MLKKYATKIFHLFIKFLFISFLVFIIIDFLPQEHTLISKPQQMSPQQYELIQSILWNRSMHTNSIAHRYIIWITQLLKGNLGYSFLFKQDILSVLKPALLHTFFYNSISLIITLPSAICLALYMNTKKVRFRKILQRLSILVYSFPTYFVAILIIYILSVQLKLLPSSGMPEPGTTTLTSLKYYILPTLTISIPNFFYLYRHCDLLINQHINSDYIKICSMYGYSKFVIYRYILRACFQPFIILLLHQIQFLFVGSILIEHIFAIEGIGQILYLALKKRDVFLILSIQIFYVFIYLITNFIDDIIYENYRKKVIVHE